MITRRSGWLVSLLLLTGSVLAQEFVYVESNVGQVLKQNSVCGYSVSAQGNLKALTGSPYLTRATGVYSANPLLAPGFLSDQQIVANAAGTLLFAVNGHSDGVTVFSINSDGSLTFLNKTSSNGQDPVSLGLDESSPAGSQLTVLNQAQDPGQSGGIPNITSFLVDGAGTLTRVNGGVVHFLQSASPFQALPSPSGRFLFVPEFPTASVLNSYSIGAAGRFVLNNFVSPSSGTQFRGVAAHPTQRVLYVALKDTNLIEIFTYNTQGLLAYSGTVADPGVSVTWLTTDKPGTRLFASEPDSDGVTSYDISSGNSLAPVQLQNVTLKTGGNATQLRVNPAGTLLFVLGLDETGTGGSFLHVLNIDSSGMLTETVNPVQIPVAAGEIPQGIAVVH